MTRLQTTKLSDQVREFASKIRQQAEMETLRGALALERGDVSQAESSLRHALSIGQSEAEAPSDNRRAAQGMLSWLSRPQATIP
jgi:hypothetical protein